MRHILHYHIHDVEPYINWLYFFHAWDIPQSEAEGLLQEAKAMLREIDGSCLTHALVGIYEAWSEGDDIVVDGTVRLPMLRQQQGETCLCLSDYIRPKGAGELDRIALFCASVDESFVTSDEDDPYRHLLSQTLADRLAEATAERANEEVRKRLWAYAPDEQLTPQQLFRNEFQGIRPAVGYPSLPDQSINFLLDQALHFSDINVSLTESGAMLPHASVSGLMIANPRALYFSVGRIGADQLRDYSLRRGLSLERTKHFLTSNL